MSGMAIAPLAVILSEHFGETRATMRNQGEAAPDRTAFQGERDALSVERDVDPRFVDLAHAGADDGAGWVAFGWELAARRAHPISQTLQIDQNTLDRIGRTDEREAAAVSRCN